MQRLRAGESQGKADYGVFTCDVIRVGFGYGICSLLLCRHIKSDNLDIGLAMPPEVSGSEGAGKTNPEELFAALFAASCMFSFSFILTPFFFLTRIRLAC